LKINIDYESKQKRGRKEKAEAKNTSGKPTLKQAVLNANADIIEIRDSSSKHEDPQQPKIGKRTSR